MIEKVLKASGRRIRMVIPTELKEVSIGQIIELQEMTSDDDLRLVSIMTYLPEEDLKDISVEDFALIKDRMLSLAHQMRYDYDRNKVPEKVEFKISGGKPKTVKVNKNLAIEPYGAFCAAKDLIAEEIGRHISLYGDNWRMHLNPNTRTCCKILAHYFYCPVTGNKYDEAEAEQFYEVVKYLPVTVALPIAQCFFLKYPNLSKPKISFWGRLQQAWKKGQALGRSKSSNTSIRSIR